MKKIQLLLLTFIIICNAKHSDAITLRVYGPEGPSAPMNECAELFSKRTDFEVEVISGPESKWINKSKQDADLIYGEAEYMLTHFMQNYPALVDGNTRKSLYIRPVGILVRKSNPRKIKGFTDLTNANIRLLDVNGAGQIGMWEDIAKSQVLTSMFQRNIAASVTTSAEAIDKWKSMPELGAWLTYESWHFHLKEISDLVRLSPERRIYRGTPIAITIKSNNKKAAAQFIEFLKTEDAHTIFQKWGWR